MQIVATLNQMFGMFDVLSDKNNIYKVAKICISGAKKRITSSRWRRSRTASSVWLEPLRSKQKLPILKVARLSLKMIPFIFQTSSTFKGEESRGADHEHGDGYARLSLLCQGAATLLLFKEVAQL